jgi:hypothetical protein
MTRTDALARATTILLDIVTIIATDGCYTLTKADAETMAELRSVIASPSRCPGRPRLTPPNKEALRSMYLELGRTDTAKQLGVSRPTIDKWRKSFGIPNKRSETTAS